MLKSFSALDKDGDGFISKSELIEGLRTIMTDLEAELEAEKILKKIDLNGNNMIDYSEWVTATINKQKHITIEKL
jgi:calcium-dependent protein kinase